MGNVFLPVTVMAIKKQVRIKLGKTLLGFLVYKVL